MEGLGWTCNKNDEQISYRFLLLVRRTYCLIPQVILYGMGVGVLGFLIFFLVLFLRINRMLLFMAMIYFLIDLLVSVTNNNAEFYSIKTRSKVHFPLLLFLLLFFFPIHEAYSFLDQNNVVFNVTRHIHPAHTRFFYQITTSFQ